MVFKLEFIQRRRDPYTDTQISSESHRYNEIVNKDGCAVWIWGTTITRQTDAVPYPPKKSQGKNYSLLKQCVSSKKNLIHKLGATIFQDICTFVTLLAHNIVIGASDDSIVRDEKMKGFGPACRYYVERTPKWFCRGTQHLKQNHEPRVNCNFMIFCHF